MQFSISKQFQCQRQFYFKQFSLAYVHCLVLFNPQIGPYQVLPLRARVDRGAMAIKGYSAFPKAPALLEPPHEIFQCHIQDTSGERSLNRLQKCSLCILQPLLTGPLDTHLGRDAVGVFYSPCRLGHRTLIGEVLHLYRDAVGVFCNLSRQDKVSFYFLCRSQNQKGNHLMELHLEFVENRMNYKVFWLSRVK